jgi:hypothetical protein
MIITMRALALTLLLGIAFSGSAERSATTALVMRVGPESFLDPEQVVLRFRVSSDGGSDVTTQSAVIAAKARPLPGQQIRVTARSGALSGPAGSIAPGSVRWTASNTGALGGGGQAKCSSGAFVDASAQDLVAGWNLPGALSCSVVFELAGARSLPAGVYTALVSLAIEMR